MFSFLLSFAMAADIPVGARVVLPASAPVTTAAGAPLLPSASGTWGARVLLDLGDRLVVEPEVNACQRSLAMSPSVQLRVAVEEAALLPLTTRALSGKGSAGEQWELAAGVVVREGAVDLGAVGRLKLPLPPEALGTWTTEALLPSSFPDGDHRVGPPRGPLMFLGQPLTMMDGLTVHQEDDRVYWKGGCGGISFLLPPNVPFAEPVQNIGGILGGLGTLPMGKVPAGTTLYWPDGEEAGKSPTELQLQNLRQTGEVWCGDFRLEGGNFQLCTSEIREMITERPDATSGAGSPIILGALDKALIDAVIRENMKKISTCYRRGQKEEPGIAGRVTIKFVIATDGTVSSAQVKSTTLNSPTTEDCMVRAFLKMTFPKPKGGGIVIVSYPFTFSP